jgi:hypothetical protein
MARGRRCARGALCAALCATASSLASAQQFSTSLAGLGGTPIGLTPIGAPGTTTLQVQWLTSTDPLVRACSTVHAVDATCSTHLWGLRPHGAPHGSSCCTPRSCVHGADANVCAATASCV